MLHLTKIQIASIAVASVLASYAAAGSLASQNLSEDSQDISIEQALFEMQYADAAQVDYFLKVDGIPGESMNERHQGEIDVLSFHWGVTQQGTSGGGGGAGKPLFSDFFITKMLDKSSPLLFKACARGDHLPAVQLTLEKATEKGGKPVKYLEIKLTDVMVSSFQMGGQTGDIPTEQVSFSFAKVHIKYTQVDDKGKVVANVEADWDLTRNE